MSEVEKENGVSKGNCAGSDPKSSAFASRFLFVVSFSSREDMPRRSRASRREIRVGGDGSTGVGRPSASTMGVAIGRAMKISFSSEGAGGGEVRRPFSSPGARPKPHPDKPHASK